MFSSCSIVASSSTRSVMDNVSSSSRSFEMPGEGDALFADWLFAKFFTPTRYGGKAFPHAGHHMMGIRRGNPRRLSRRELAAIDRGWRARSICVKGTYFWPKTGWAEGTGAALGGRPGLSAPHPTEKGPGGSTTGLQTAWRRTLGLPGTSQNPTLPYPHPVVQCVLPNW